MTCPLRGVAAQANGAEAARGTLMTDDLTCKTTHTCQKRYTWPQPPQGDERVQVYTRP